VADSQTKMLFRFGPAGRIRFANLAARRAFGLTNVALNHLTWHALVPPDQRAGVAGRLRELGPATAVVRTETRFIGEHGDVRSGEFLHHGSFDAFGRLVGVRTVGQDVTERHRIEQQLARAAAHLQDLYDHAPCGYCSLDARFQFVQISATALAWFGCTAEEAVGRLGPKDFLTPEGVAGFEAHFAQCLAQGHAGPLEVELSAGGGTGRRVCISSWAIRDPGGTLVRSCSAMYDVTGLAGVRRAVRSQSLQHEAAAGSELIGIAKVRDGRALWSNSALERIFGHGPGQLEGQSLRCLFMDDQSYEAMETGARATFAAARTFRRQMRMARKDGLPVWVDLICDMTSPEAGESTWVMLDITATMAHQEVVEQALLRDSLTGLPNRILLSERIHQALAVAECTGSLVAVCSFGLDGFKTVTDRFGSAAGETLLQVAGRRLQQCIRRNDTVARLSGDRFVLLLAYLRGSDACHQVLGRVLAAMAEPVELGSSSVDQVSASVGVAFYPKVARDGNLLLRFADDAMQVARLAGRRVEVAQP